MEDVLKNWYFCATCIYRPRFITSTVLFVFVVWEKNLPADLILYGASLKHESTKARREPQLLYPPTQLSIRSVAVVRSPLAPGRGVHHS